MNVLSYFLKRGYIYAVEERCIDGRWQAVCVRKFFDIDEAEKWASQTDADSQKYLCGKSCAKDAI